MAKPVVGVVEVRFVENEARIRVEILHALSPLREYPAVGQYFKVVEELSRFGESDIRYRLNLMRGRGMRARGLAEVFVEHVAQGEIFLARNAVLADRRVVVIACHERHEFLVSDRGAVRT